MEGIIAGMTKKAKKTAKRRHPVLGFLFKFGLVLMIAGVIGLIYVDQLVRDKFEGKRWSVPARVYARPLEVHVGMEYPAAALARELRALGYRERPKAKSPGEFSRSSSRISVYTRGFQFWDGAEPARQLVLRYSGNTVSGLSGSRGEKVSLARLDPLLIGGMYPAHHEDRILVGLEQVPESLADALVAVEDRHFYKHHGVVPRSILRALLANVRAGGVVQGGSTLTQQLVKNFYLTSEQTLARKGYEAIMAVLLELHYSKQEILEAYLNEIYLGQSGKRAIHGFGLGAQFYFRQPLAELELHQVALLAGMVKGPSAYNPRRYPERSKKRRNLVLKMMADSGAITADEAKVAQQEPLGVAPKPSWSDAMFPAFMDLVRRQIRRDYKEEDLTTEGLRIFTTLDPHVQWQAEESLERTVASLEKGYRIKRGSVEGALVITRTEGGEVLGLVGGREARYSGFNRALDAVRPIGSLVKPAVYLAALEQAQTYSLASRIEDAPLEIEARPGEIWSPQNYDKKSHGMVPMHQALARSLNQATVRLGMDLGVPRVIETLRKLGVTRDLQPYPSLLLGSASLSPLEVVQIYQTIAGGGFSVHLRSIREVSDARGEPLSRYPLAVTQQFDPATMHLLQYALQVAVSEGTGKGAYRRLGSDLQIAGKTGTTNDLRDSWFSGYTGDFLAVAWLGRDDNGKMPLTGSTGALQVWTDLMVKLRPQPLIAPVPDRVAYHWIEEASGLLANEQCQGARYLPFVEGSAPRSKHRCAGLFSQTIPDRERVEDVVRDGVEFLKDKLRRWLP